MKITVQLMGGLGNQMFQYAYGRTLSVALRRPLLLDTSYLKSAHVVGDTPREFELHVFNVHETAGHFPPAPPAGQFLPYRLRRLFAAWIPNKELVLQDGGPFPSLADEKRPIRLEGFFQNYSLFNHNKRAVKNWFAFRSGAGQKNEQLMKKMAMTPSVSIHVRRGDYIKNEKTRQFHGICGPEYYREALKLIADRVEGPEYFVFSDDMDWCRSFFSGLHKVTFVDHNIGADSFRDMQLMSCCRHHIIANSSFSWWGAWLGTEADHIVIAPQRWFNADIDTGQLCPEEWIRI